MRLNVLISMSIWVFSASVASAQSPDKEIPYDLLSSEQAHKYSRDAGFLTTQLRALEAIIAARKSTSWQKPAENLTAAVIDELITRKHSVVLYGDEILDELAALQSLIKRDKPVASQILTQKVEKRIEEGFNIAIAKEAENLWTERKVFLQHYNGTWEWPNVSWSRIGEIIRYYHDGSLQAFGEFPSSSAYFERTANIAHRLADHAGFILQEIHVIKTKKVSAYVLGQNVYVTQGLLDLYSDDGDVGMILGHEIGHIVLEHGKTKIAKTILKESAFMAVNVFTLGGTVNRFIDWSRGKIGYPPRYGNDSPATRWKNQNLTRTSVRIELQADEFGLRLSTAALDWNPERAPTLWRKLYEQKDHHNLFDTAGTLLHKSIVPGYRSHPLLEDRINFSQYIAQKIATGK